MPVQGLLYLLHPAQGATQYPSLKVCGFILLFTDVFQVCQDDFILIPQNLELPALQL